MVDIFNKILFLFKKNKGISDVKKIENTVNNSKKTDAYSIHINNITINNIKYKE